MDNNITIKEWKCEFNKDITNLLSTDIHYIPSYSMKNNYFLIYTTNKIIGIGALWMNAIHPYREYISIFISPTNRRKSYGKLLFEYMKSKCTLNNLQTAFDSQNESATHFATSCGFHLARKCYIPIFKKEDMKELYFVTDTVLIPMTELNPLQKNTVYETLYQDYMRKHKLINPLSKSITVDNFKSYIIDDLSETDSYVTVNEDHICSYLLSYEVDNHTISVGYIGNSTKDESGILLYQKFLYNILDNLYKKYTYLELEIDDCDDDAMLLRELFTKQVHDSWDTYIKN
ncbi:GNAT family N-acetyltransferase [Anaeromicropila herbilytica]|uniref:N-acetyltransferase n=1 Tax=Anaeromicropila herbilytica TaxID=2785025 RepID=A0A7R7ICZ3_9FIRM|nr:GNAT family N-acetyltransferase [Anaeromicropila herbilytica]BCN30366.1 N-acetyltransferase [Anaeromicropila herbilytica]